jgi:hypothetical protein
MLSAGLATTSGGDITVFAVYSQASVGANQWLVTGFVPDHETGGVSYIGTVDGGGYHDITVAQTGDQQAEWHLDSSITTATVYRDGVAIGSDAGTTPTDIAAGTGYIGSSPVVPGTETFDGVLSELIVFERVLTAGEITSIRAYLTARYALTFSPLSVASCFSWLRSDLGVTLNGTDVSGWADQSGNSNDAAQATIALQPPYNATDADFNSHPSIAPVAGAWPSDHLVFTCDPGAVSAMTIFAIVKPSCSTVLGYLWDANGADRTIICTNYAGVSSVGIYDGTWWRATAACTGDTQVLTYRLDTNDLTIRRDSVQIGTYGTYALRRMKDGVLFVAQAGSDTKIAELIVYNRALVTEELAGLEAYAITRYSL